MPRDKLDYLMNAAECLRLARTMKTPEQKDALLHMAATWEKLARKIVTQSDERKAS